MYTIQTNLMVKSAMPPPLHPRDRKNANPAFLSPNVSILLCSPLHEFNYTILKPCRIVKFSWARKRISQLKTHFQQFLSIEVNSEYFGQPVYYDLWYLYTPHNKLNLKPLNKTKNSLFAIFAQRQKCIWIFLCSAVKDP